MADFGVTRAASSITNGIIGTTSTGGNIGNIYDKFDDTDAPAIYYNIQTDGAVNDIRMFDVVNDVNLNPYAQLIRGTMSFSPDRLKEIDPAYTGHTQVFVLRMPPILTVPADSGQQLPGFDSAQTTTGTGNSAQTKSDVAAAHARHLKLLFEMGSTAYSGTPELTLNTTDVNVGWNDRNYSVPTFSEYGSKTFTLRCIELRGNLLQRGCQYCINGMSDVGLKGSHMNGGIFGGELLSPSQTNFTWMFMMVQTDVTRLNIQDIGVWANAFITSVDNSNFDWEEGQVDVVQPREVQFQGNYIQATQIPVFQYAAKVLMKRRLKYYMRHQDMTADMFNLGGWGNWNETIGASIQGLNGTTATPAQGTPAS